MTEDDDERPLFERLKESLEEYAAYKRGEPNEIMVIKVKRRIPANVDVKAIRTRLGLTQQQFTRFGFSLSAIRHWERNRRTPEGAARVLLMVIAKSPELVLQTLEAA
ncbi:MAG: putative transcriptional regulator [Hyphomonadaceae bacterium]|nr:MAG: putative transcriptional regulator [Hyphomonadaceae bacterium]KAF0186043.1 MAG: putative transcriptional regulator [Hyphomonadaceae bacterium]